MWDSDRSSGKQFIIVSPDLLSTGQEVLSEGIVVRIAGRPGISVFVKRPRRVVEDGATEQPFSFY